MRQPTSDKVQNAMISLATSSQSASGLESVRPHVRGKFIFVGDTKWYLRGVTYGTFSADAHGNMYDHEMVEHDFAQMAANGITTVRLYTVPPAWLLDAAQRHGLYVMVGLAWEQHIAFLDDRRARSIEARIIEQVRSCAGHPAILCYAIGNEIPASMVRWYGHRPVEQFLARLYRAVKSTDPGSLVTYVNYPSTEYLELPFIDFVCFNVFLEAQAPLEAYLARLQNIAGDRPLVLSELGLDSRSHGETSQAITLDWQVRTAFASGCAGAFVFAWTDEWYRGGAAIEDWDFGLTRRDRQPKPALAAVRDAFANVPFPADMPWPRISVVVCSYNGARTIGGCLEGITKLDYPDYEVIVVNDGSTDATETIARQFPVRLVTTDQRGLSNARNLGMGLSSGEIVAYLDDDAYPDQHWLTYLAATFMSTSYACVGGPNIAPPGDGPIADCIDNAPGNPTHILLSDGEAEHIPGCNMAFRKADLQAIDGFDPFYRVAGDDVDVCWRLQQRGLTLGFSPAAMVWHHRRYSLRSFWKQQYGYGKAEALLEQKWPERYSGIGYLTWSGRLYGKGQARSLRWRRGHIHHGVWGTALFQSLYEPASGMLSSLPLMSEWYLIIIALGLLATLGVLWAPLLLALPLLILAIGASLVQAGLSAARASFSSTPASPIGQLKLYGLTAFLHLFQPFARLYGRVGNGLTPWRWRGTPGFVLPWPRTTTIWSERWQAADGWLSAIETTLRASGAVVMRGGDYDRWELEVRAGLFSSARMRMAIEEHGQGQQLVRMHSWPRCSASGLILLLLPAAFAIGATWSWAWTAAAIFGVLSLLVGLRMLLECCAALATLRQMPHTDQHQAHVLHSKQVAATDDRYSVQQTAHQHGSDLRALHTVQMVADDLVLVRGASPFGATAASPSMWPDASGGD
jgi:GT2 family glycosyltransferase